MAASSIPIAWKIRDMRYIRSNNCSLVIPSAPLSRRQLNASE